MTEGPARMPGERAAVIWGSIATLLVVVSTIGIFLVAQLMAYGWYLAASPHKETPQ